MSASSPRGSVSVVGLGPGAADLLSPRARRILQSADAVVGYARYIDMVRAWVPEAHCVASPIGEERVRAMAALSVAATGKHIAVVSSGDPGIYAMAGLVLELAAMPAYANVDVSVVPGITAAQAAAAVAGAPLMLDYATISLSDQLIPWAQIERRLIAALDADFVLALYNPNSGRRAQRFSRAVELLATHRAPATPCAVVRNASRSDEQAALLTITDLTTADASLVDMLTILIVGNSTSRITDGRLITPRGYAVDVPSSIPDVRSAVDALIAEMRATLTA